jgi:hypothetical protein
MLESSNYQTMSPSTRAFHSPTIELLLQSIHIPMTSPLPLYLDLHMITSAKVDCAKRNLISHFTSSQKTVKSRHGGATSGIDYRNNAELYEDHADRFNWDKDAGGWGIERVAVEVTWGDVV